MDLNIITDENLDDLVTTAWYGGITYWAGSVRDDLDVPVGTLIALEDREDDDKVYFIDAQQLRKAYAMLLDLDQKFVNDDIHSYFISSYRDRDENGIEMGAIDALAADAWVQVACFDKVVYG